MADDDDETLEEEIDRLQQEYRQAREKGETEKADFYARRLRSLGADPEA